MPETVTPPAELPPTHPIIDATPQGAQYQDLLGAIVAKLEKFGTSFAGLDEKFRQQCKQDALEIAKLRGDVAALQLTARQRFEEAAARTRGAYWRSRYYETREQALAAGRFIRAVYQHRSQEAALAELQRAAAVQPSTGPEGGHLEVNAVQAGIIRNVETYGVFERDARPVTLGGQASAIPKRTGGLTCNYPQLGVIAASSAPSVGMINFDLTVYQTYCPVDRYMLEDDLLVPLAEFVAEEMGLILAYSSDLNGFMGDGGDSYARVKGLFKTAGGADVTADSGDDTFAEVAAASTKYLGACLGKLPQWAVSDPNGVKWYGHLSAFFLYAAVRDTTGRPLGDLFAAPAGGLPVMSLAQFPFQPAQVCPSATAVSTAFIAAANLRRAYALARHRSGTRFFMSEHVLALYNQVAMLADFRQDIKAIDTTAFGRIITAAS